MIVIFLIYLAVISLATFLLFWTDKRRAQYNGALEKAARKRNPPPLKPMKQRIPEKTLFILAALGGSIGAIAGMWIFRHKTKHWYFVYGMPTILAAQLMIAWVAMKGI